MQKIISLFKRHYGDGPRLVYNELVPGAEWVTAGEGIATRKWDGTSVLIHDGDIYKRHEVKKGKTPPSDFRACGDRDPVTGKQTGWVPVTDGPEDRWYREALTNNDATAADYPNGTYELVGPKINGNPEGFNLHTLLPHGLAALPTAPRTYDALRDYLATADIEGIVWHHPDGRMVKIKAKDFGLRRPTKGKTA